MRQKTLIDDAPLRRFHLRIAALAAGGPFCDGYILGVIGIALALLTPQLHLNSVWVGLILAFTVFTVSESAGSALQYVYPNEIFPTHIRATAMGFATAMSRIGAAVSTFLLPVGYSTIGAGPSMLILWALIVLGLIVAVLWAPETKGLTLAEASLVSPAPAASPILSTFRQ